MIKQRLIALNAKLDLNSGLQYWLLAAITLLALALRFFKLGQWSFWIDEIYTINHAQAHFSSLALILQHIPPHRNWVPISVISTASALNLAGTSEWSARLASVLIGVVSIPLLYFPIKRLFGVAVGLIAVLLLAVSPWHLYWSQNARFYTALLLFYTLALFAFFYGLERDRLRYILLFMLLSYHLIRYRVVRP
jgi:4-amino-4-deoxy-L-arabinose transferase-like glycosyltransferase